jgi:hypothetical protein
MRFGMFLGVYKRSNFLRPVHARLLNTFTVSHFRRQNCCWEVLTIADNCDTVGTQSLNVRDGDKHFWE